MRKRPSRSSTVGIGDVHLINIERTRPFHFYLLAARGGVVDTFCGAIGDLQATAGNSNKSGAQGDFSFNGSGDRAAIAIDYRDLLLVLDLGRQANSVHVHQVGHDRDTVGPPVVEADPHVAINGIAVDPAARCNAVDLIAKQIILDFVRPLYMLEARDNPLCLVAHAVTPA
ncbi:hypothetical protein D3C81_1746060 [compost metagenome]